MRWTERQRAMLREIGIAPFWPEELAAPADMVEPLPAAQAAHATSPDPAAAFFNGAANANANANAQALHAPSPSAAPISVPPHAGDAAEQVQVSPASGASTRPAAKPQPSAAPSSPHAPTASAAQAQLGPRPEGIDRMGWPALRQAVSGCQACGLCRSRTQAVFGTGNEQAEWMIIGEAPGEQEDKQGEPFVGRAGQLLDRMLHAVGLTRAEDESPKQVFIANVLKCRPPANRNPLPQEVAQCEPYLMRQIELVRPKVIIAMGRFAVQSLLKSAEPIGRLRGKVHELGGVPVVVTYHPAYLLRSPSDKALAWDDLCLAREVWAAAGPRQISPPNTAGA